MVRLERWSSFLSLNRVGMLSAHCPHHADPHGGKVSTFSAIRDIYASLMRVLGTPSMGPLDFLQRPDMGPGALGRAPGLN